jgi:hypothetical protein
MAPADCPYCRDWSRAHPEAAPRLSCGPCETCGKPGHVGAHPRQPTSVCLCAEHWAALAARGYHFELYHLVYVVIGLVAASVVYRIVQDLMR